MYMYISRIATNLTYYIASLHNIDYIILLIEMCVWGGGWLCLKWGFHLQSWNVSNGPLPRSCILITMRPPFSYTIPGQIRLSILQIWLLPFEIYPIQFLNQRCHIGDSVSCFLNSPSFTEFLYSLLRFELN